MDGSGNRKRKVTEVSPGGSREVVVTHDATPSGEMEGKEKQRRLSRNNQTSRRARKRLEPGAEERRAQEQIANTAAKAMARDAVKAREVCAVTSSIAAAQPPSSSSPPPPPPPN